MASKIARTDTDFNTIQWMDDLVAIAPQSDSHVQISRFTQTPSKPEWSIAVDVTSGHRMLSVAGGNRLACLGNRHLLALTCGAYANDNSLHNHALHYIHPDGQVLWSRNWHTIERFTLVGAHLLVIRYLSPPHFWIDDVPLEAHLLDTATGESVAQEPVPIPLALRTHYQSWEVSQLKSYLVWKAEQLILTVRPKFHPKYVDAHTLPNRGSFKHVLSLHADERD